MIINYPVFLDLDSRPCLVVGGGRVAYRKLKRLTACGAEIELVSPRVIPRIRDLLADSRIKIEKYRAEYCRGKLLVFAATDDQKLNEKIAGDAGNYGALVNVVNRPRLCDFIVPSLVDDGTLQIAISTGGKSPALARKLRQELEAKIAVNKYGDRLEVAGEIRELVKETVADEEIRRKLFRKLAELIQVNLSN